MGNCSKETLGIESIMEAWTQSFNDFGETVSTAWSQAQSRAPFGADADGDEDPIALMTNAFKSWQAMASPAAMESILTGSHTLPEIYAQFARSVVLSLSEFQKRIYQDPNRFDPSGQASGLGNLRDNSFIWSEIYEKEFQKFFHIPKIGLTREHQERFNTMFDKFNMFQARYAEFQRLLLLPFQRAVTEIQDQVLDLTRKGELPEDSQAYYRMWIKSLETQFTALFKTREYVEALAHTLTSLTDFSKEKDAVFETFFKGLPIVRQSEMDEVTKEIYELKRRIRRLEKEKQAKANNS